MADDNEKTQTPAKSAKAEADANQATATKDAGKASSSSDPAFEAKHRGGGSYSVMQGDEEVIPSLNKEQAEAFNALSEAKRFDYVEEWRQSQEGSSEGQAEQDPDADDDPAEEFTGGASNDDHYRKGNLTRILGVILRMPKNLRRGPLRNHVESIGKFLEEIEDEEDRQRAYYLLRELADSHPEDIPNGSFKTDIRRALNVINDVDEKVDPAEQRAARLAAASRLNRATERHSNISSAPKGPDGEPGTDEQTAAASRLYG